MIYAKQTSDPQTLYVPRNIFMMEAGDFVLGLKNTVSNSRMAIKPDGVVLGSIYYELTVSFPDDMTIGEYEYQLSQGDCLMASGLLQIGEYNYDRTEYAESIQYIQHGRG